MDTTTVSGPSLRAGRREWVGLAVLALPTLLLSLDFSVLFLALPHLGADLGAGGTELLWIQDIYGFMIAGFLVTMGTLGDRIGRRKLLMIGAAVFGAVSVVSAYSASAEMLIVARALLGIAGATLMPSTLALISNMFRDPRQRSTAISIWATCLLVGVAAGPLVGGVLLELFWWGSVFLMGVPVMVLLLATAPTLLPEYRDRNAGRLDLISVVLSLAAILPLIYGLKEFAKDGLALPTVLAIAVGVVLGVVFVQRQRMLSDPLLDVRLFKDRAFSAALGILLFGAVAVGGIGFLFAQYLQLVHGLSPLQAGLLMLPDAAGLIVGALLAPVIARRIRPAYAVGLGMAISAAGFFMLTQASATSGLVISVIGIAILSFGIAPSWVLGTDLIVGSAPPEKAGSAAAVSETSAEFGVALGVAVLGSIGTAVYRGELGDAVPAGVPAEATAATVDSLVGATAAAAQLPDQLGVPLLAAAREAFTSGFTMASAASIPALLLLAVLGVVLLRRLNPSDEADEAVTDEAVVADPVAITTVGTKSVESKAIQRGVRQVSGRGVLARAGDLVVLCEVSPGQGAQVGALVDTLAMVAAERGCGAELSRRLAALVTAAGTDGFPSLCAFGPSGDGLAAVVHGRAEMTIAANGHELRLDGREAATVVDRLVAAPVRSIRAMLGDADADLHIERWDDGTAVVNGERTKLAELAENGNGHAELTAAGNGHAEDIETTVALPQRPEPPTAQLPEQQAPCPPEVSCVADHDSAPGAVGDEVFGVYCRREHFNDPKMAYCTVCGISMAQATRMPVLGRRPALGVLVLDDGSMYPLVRDLVFGRVPDADQAVIAGTANPVRLDDPSVSRVHARVTLDGWDVSLIDADSTNGTFLCDQEETTWTRLPRGARVALRPGTVAAFGRRQLRYHSHRAQSVDFSSLESLRTRE